MARPLDFICIGAPKAGTTSVFHYLRAQKGIYLPSNKEAPYFSDECPDHGNWGQFWVKNFSNAPDTDLVGTISPQYMGDLGIPNRIAAEMPDVKLFCILRNPIDRAYSDFRMRRLRGTEDRNFREVIADQLKPENVAKSRGYRQGVDRPEIAYLARSEYGRILGQYLHYFNYSAMKITFSEDLRNDPGGTISTIMSYLGNSNRINDRGFQKQYYVGGKRSRLWPAYSALKEISAVRAIWRFLPLEVRKYLSFRVKTDWGISSSSRPEIGKDARNALHSFFKRDVETLRRVWNVEPPWPEFKDDA